MNNICFFIFYASSIVLGGEDILGGGVILGGGDVLGGGEWRRQRLINQKILSKGFFGPLVIARFFKIQCRR